ncbi:MAG: glutamate--tRNA ligase [FCB group bacterium]|nr:glutamate--tRNA ligase [FCB group bacterium]
MTSDSQNIRVRIAPSPSGYLHVGTARTAIFNYLFARHNKGKFLIRIEDTDASRSRKELIEPIFSALKWLGMNGDEEIIYQSQRLGIYKDFAQKILDNGFGYRCFCSPEQLEKDREEAKKNKQPFHYNRRCLNLSQNEIEQKLADGEKFAIRIKIPSGETVFHDMVSGDLKRDNSEIEDFIIARSNGIATYNLAVVVDDHQMGITHVIRGNDHITNTFKQVHIYKALGFEPPQFGHVPLILRPDKRKVSKRLGDKDVAQYKEEGILPEAMFNYLTLLGWSPKTDREIYSVEELINIFTPDNFNASNAIFDEEKLLAFNKEHIARKTDHELAVLVAPLLVEAGITTKYWLETRWVYLRQVISLLKERVKRLTDFIALSNYFFNFDYKYELKAREKYFNLESAQWLSELAERFERLDPFTVETIETVITELAEKLGIKRGQLIHPTRLAVSGTSKGPGLYEMLYVLSRPIVIERIKRASDYIKKAYDLKEHI